MVPSTVGLRVTPGLTAGQHAVSGSPGRARPDVQSTAPPGRLQLTTTPPTNQTKKDSDQTRTTGAPRTWGASRYCEATRTREVGKEKKKLTQTKNSGEATHSRCVCDPATSHTKYSTDTHRHTSPKRGNHKHLLAARADTGTQPRWCILQISEIISTTRPKNAPTINTRPKGRLATIRCRTPCPNLFASPRQVPETPAVAAGRAGCMLGVLKRHGKRRRHRSGDLHGLPPHPTASHRQPALCPAQP